MNKKIEQEARRMALEWLNDNRKHDGKPLLRRLEPLWWRIYGKDWMAKAKLKTI